MKIWEAKYECMPREELEQLQLERLQATLNRVYKNVTFYRKIFNESKIVPEDMQALSDLAKIPFTTKDDMRMNYPYGMFAVPLREVVRVHSSSGTTEKPVGLTWIAIASPDGVSASSYLFGDDRGRNIRKTALQALNLLRKKMLDAGY